MASQIAKTHGLVSDQVEVSVCSPNRAQHPDESGPARRVQNLSALQPNYAHKRYTILAQAMLIRVRKNEDLRIQSCLSDDSLCRALSPLLNSTDGTINDSIDTLSDKFQAQLRQDKVAGLLACFFPLQGYSTRNEQAEVAASSLRTLQQIGVISEIGHSEEDQLHIMAKVCGKLCFKNTFELPTGLDDTMLPDLLAKFTIMEVARDRWTAS